MTLPGMILLVIIFLFCALNRRRLSALIRKIKLPALVLYFAASVPLIIVEELVNCSPAWCHRVLVPPTLLPVLFFMLFLMIGVKLTHPKTAWIPSLVFAAAGMVFEFMLGGAKAELHALLASSPLAFSLIEIWVGFSYVFVSLVPLTILIGL